jgi:hypothetical protein
MRETYRWQRPGKDTFRRIANYEFIDLAAHAANGEPGEETAIVEAMYRTNLDVKGCAL